MSESFIYYWTFITGQTILFYFWTKNVQSDFHNVFVAVPGPVTAACSYCIFIVIITIVIMCGRWAGNPIYPNIGLSFKEKTENKCIFLKFIVVLQIR